MVIRRRKTVFLGVLFLLIVFCVGRLSPRWSSRYNKFDYVYEKADFAQTKSPPPTFLGGSCPRRFVRPFADDCIPVPTSNNNNNTDINTTTPSHPIHHHCPRVFHLSAKFGRNHSFKNDVLAHGAYLRDTGMFAVVDHHNNNSSNNSSNNNNSKHNIWEYYSFPDWIVRDSTWKNNLHFLKRRHRTDRGGGYWFWKPVLIEHHLQSSLLAEGGFLIYSDNDLLEHLQILPDLLSQMVQRNHNLALHEMHGNRNERTFTKRDVYEAYCPGRNIVQDTSFQYEAMLIILRKDPATLQFVSQFRHGASNFHALSDERSWLPNHASEYVWKNHRRDQSLLNLILKCRYQQPGKELYKASSSQGQGGGGVCGWRTIQTYGLPVWDPNKITKLQKATDETFVAQERIYRVATRAALANASDPYWKTYYSS